MNRHGAAPVLRWLKASCFAAKLAVQKRVLKAGLAPALAELPKPFQSSDWA